MKFFGQLFGTNSDIQAKPSSADNHFPKEKYQSKKNSSNDQKTCSQKQDHSIKIIQLPINKVIQIKLCKAQIIPKTKSQKTHMVYQIYVKTIDFSYNLKKRFSEFYQFYAEIQQHIKHLPIQFPKKTIMTSGTNVEVVNHRFKLLNIFLQNILYQIHGKKDKKLAASFFNFIQLGQQYKKWQKLEKKQQIHIKQIKEQINLKQNILEGNFYKNDGCIEIQIKKLNYFQHSSEIIDSIQFFIQIRGFRLTNEQIRILLVGIQSYKGLISLALSSENQIKAIQLLDFLYSILATQMHSYNQKFFKIFQNLSPCVFSFQKKTEVHQSIQFKKIFFKILQLYLKNKLISIEQILKEDLQLIQQFNNWKTFFQMKEVNKKSINYLDVQQKVFVIEKTKSSLGQSTCPSGVQMIKSCKSFQYLSNNQEYLKAFTNQFMDKNRSSSKSNMSTSQIALQQEWQKSQMKKEIQEQERKRQNLQFIKIIQKQQSSLMSNLQNKLTIQLLTQIQQSECALRFRNWNKLIIDERSDPFTDIQRCIYLLNDKQKIFKFKKFVEDNQISHQTKIIRRRLTVVKSMQSLALNSLINQSFKQKGFQEILTFKKLTHQGKYKTKVTLNFDFTNQEDYFSTQIKGTSTFLYESAISALY